MRTRHLTDCGRLSSNRVLAAQGSESWLAYSNYVDEVLIMSVNASPVYSYFKYYVHDHLYSPVALTNSAGTAISSSRTSPTTQTAGRTMEIPTCSPAEGLIYSIMAL